MPRAEVGSTKWQANKMKSKGLQRLRWYCQACEKQCRDENGFKCHVQSESHVRQMTLIGEDPRKAINDFSQQFKRDFLLLLRTSHGEKKINLNHFYQEYIRNKEHIHMNATQWPSLTEFGKYLGREGICRVSEDEKGNGLCIAWIDNSPEALRRQEAVKRKERQERGDEEREQRLIQEQVQKARAEVKEEAAKTAEDRALQRKDGEKIQLNLKPSTAKAAPSPQESQSPTPGADGEGSPGNEPTAREGDDDAKAKINEEPTSAPVAKPTVKIGMSLNKPKNVFSSKNNPLASKKVTVKEQPKKMSEAERIMKEELERKRLREKGGAHPGAKRQKVA
ncbi:domain of Kin17 curved DNA-binding protein-domain-containing protein [Phyllosticta citrichinensis]|uniref:Domain of Kin17 curved DNA-binding protein-domain-containing protein n=1 Tax=Phyllosticta citrichinensis TaxID=1130410 RepID=A0ABR1XX03_9PEZI